MILLEKAAFLKNKSADLAQELKGRLPAGQKASSLKESMADQKGKIYLIASRLALLAAALFCALTFFSVVFGITALSTGLAAPVGATLLVLAAASALSATACGLLFNYMRKKAAAEGFNFYHT